MYIFYLKGRNILLLLLYCLVDKGYVYALRYQMPYHEAQTKAEDYDAVSMVFIADNKPHCHPAPQIL